MFTLVEVLPVPILAILNTILGLDPAGCFSVPEILLLATARVGTTLGTVGGRVLTMVAVIVTSAANRIPIYHLFPVADRTLSYTVVLGDTGCRR